MLAAIADYRSMNDQMHADAAEFLFPQSAENQQHFDWVVAVIDTMNGVWLRTMLDQLRAQWDEDRVRHRSGRCSE